MAPAVLTAAKTFRCVIGRFTYVPLLNSHLPIFSTSFYDSRSPPPPFERQQHCLVWSQLLHPGSEGPTLIIYYSIRSSILRSPIRVTPIAWFLLMALVALCR